MTPAQQEQVAASSMSAGEMQADGSHVNVAGDSAPLLQLGATSDAVHAASQDGVHAMP